MSYLALDIETIKPFTSDEDWREKRPLGVACVGFSTPEKTWVTTHDLVGVPMTQEDLHHIVMRITDMVASGYTLVTWNGLGFDLQILGEEGDCMHQCKHLARSHIDMMFQILCSKGFPLSLEAAVLGSQIGTKSEGVTGAETAELWANGEYEKVFDYCRHDTELTRMMAEYGDKNRRLPWISQRGRRQQMNLPSGWLPVHMMRRMPEPDTSWMTNPLPRSKFTEWLD